VREVLHSFLLGALVEGKRFCHVRWVMDDPAVATLMGMERVRGEDALPRLGKGLDRENLRQWMNRPQTELYAVLPDRFIAGWDATVNVFDELKNQWGLRGYCSGKAVVRELAARLVLLTCNLWSLFTRLMGINPGHHTEAIKSRRNFLFLAAQVVKSGRNARSSWR
jgi:hypothetical protein